MTRLAHSIRGQMFGLGTTEIGLNYRLRNGLPVPTVPPLPPGAKETPHVNFVDPEFMRVLENKAHPLHEAAAEFYLHLALNHEVGVCDISSNVLRDRCRVASVHVFLATRSEELRGGRNTVTFERGDQCPGCFRELLNHTARPEQR